MIIRLFFTILLQPLKIRNYFYILKYRVVAHLNLVHPNIKEKKWIIVNFFGAHEHQLFYLEILLQNGENHRFFSNLTVSVQSDVKTSKIGVKKMGGFFF